MGRRAIGTREVDPKKSGAWLAKLMEEHHTKNSELAEFLDVSRQAVYSHRAGITPMSLVWVIDVLLFYGMDDDYYEIHRSFKKDHA